MKRQRKTFDAVLMDGGIALPPGSWVAFYNDTPVHPNHQELTAWMTRIRGGLLSDSFGLENDLILMELSNEFGVIGTPAHPSYTDKEMNLRSEHSLNKKIERSKDIVRKYRSKENADRLIQNLATCRDIRNLMAHYPCWLEPVNDEEKKRTIAFKLLIGDQSHIWEIEESDTVVWRTAFIESRQELIRIRHEILGQPAPKFLDGTVVTEAAT